MEWLTKCQKLLFLSSLQSLNTSLASLSSPALQADPRPTSLSLHQTLHQTASRSTGTISCILGVTSFISRLIFQESQEERGSPHTTSRSALTQANFQSCWREITMKGPVRMRAYPGEKNLLGIQGKKEATWALNKKICRYFNTSLSALTHPQFAHNFSSCHLSTPRDGNTSSVDIHLNKAPQGNRKYRYIPFWSQELLPAEILHTVLCGEWMSSFLFFYRCFQLII